MARENVEYPAGVSQSVFDLHTHNYRKLTQLLVDASDNWASAKPVDVVDDVTVHQMDLGQDLEAVGLAVATLPTGVPN